MRSAKHTGASAPNGSPVPLYYLFTCTSCEATEHRKNAAAPAGWGVLSIDRSNYLFCPDCATALPRGGIQ